MLRRILNYIKKYPSGPGLPPDEGLSIVTHEKEGVVVLHLAGLVGWQGFETQPWETLDHQLTQLLGAGKNRILLDLAKVRHIDDIGLGTLALFVDEVRSRGGEVKLANLTEQVRWALGITRLTEAIQICADEQEAEISFKASAAPRRPRIMNLDAKTHVAAKTPQGPIIRITFSGDYPPGSGGSHVAGAMQVITWKAVRELKPVGVIFDLLELRYVWGDGISRLVWPLLKDKKHFHFIPSCLLAQGDTAKALAPLVGSNWLPGLLSCPMFADINSARNHLFSQLGLQQSE